MLAPKMFHLSRVFHLTKYLVASLLILCLVLPYLRSHPPEYLRDQYEEVLRGFQDEKKLFVADFLQNEVGGEMDGAALARLCASKTWIPEAHAVIVSCEPVPGGIGEVKNGQLNCIRFAIEIGAQVILPRMHQRSSGDISNLQGGQTSKGLSLDYMFSTAHLVTSLRTHCPQLTVHDSLDALYDRPSLLQPLSFTLDHLTEDIAATILKSPGNLRAHFLAFMDRELPAEKRHYPVRAHLGNTLFAWPTLNETGADFRADFGKLLRVRDDVKVLAASALWNLATRHEGALPDPQARADGGGGGFVGVHLRTEQDARDAAGAWPPFDDQMGYFLDHLRNHTPAGAAPPPGPKRIVFLATGLTAQDDDVKRFRARAAEVNATVLVKRDLLDAAEIGALKALSWDQRALVDYEILLRAGTVLGIVESSFAWDVALRRGLAYGTGGPGEAAAAFVARPGGEAFASGVFERAELAMWRDRWSTLFGRADRAVDIYSGTWP